MQKIQTIPKIHRSTLKPMQPTLHFLKHFTKIQKRKFSARLHIQQNTFLLRRFVFIFTIELLAAKMSEKS
jgi:hypothetical protein